MKKYENIDAVAIESFAHIPHQEIHNLFTLNLRFIVISGVFEYFVDNFMLSNYHTLFYIASTLHSKLTGFAIDEAFSQEKDQVVINFAGLAESLVISCRKDIHTLYLHHSYKRARLNTTTVLPACRGKKIVSVSMHPADRVIIFQLESGNRLLALLFGTKANLILTDENWIVGDSFKNSKQLTGSRVEVRNVEVVYDLEELRRGFFESGARPVLSILKKTFPTLGSTLSAEILHRSNIDEATQCSSLQQEECSRILNSVAEVLWDLRRPEPRVYLKSAMDDQAKNADVVDEFSIIQLQHRQTNPVKLFDDVHEAVRFFLSRRGADTSFGQQKRDIVLRIIRHVERLERTIAAVEQDIETNQRSVEYGRFGSLLMSHLDSVGEGATGVTIGVGDDAEYIPLLSNLTAVQNAQRYFEKSKHARIAKEQSVHRLERLRTKLTPMKKTLAELDEAETKEELRSVMADHELELGRAGLDERGRAEEQVPFRVFTVEGGFQVWAGKSSSNNDLLTMKHAKPNDLWFHARGSSGSHVVLKIGSGKGEPGKKAKEQAAGIAAYYSKMRNAKHVPVAMTEKKYVRKPRGASPGTVLLEREKVIFATPALPPNHSDIDRE